MTRGSALRLHAGKNDSNNIRRRLQPEHFKIWKQAVSETVLLHDRKPIYENSRAEMENWTSLR